MEVRNLLCNFPPEDSTSCRGVCTSFTAVALQGQYRGLRKRSASGPAQDTGPRNEVFRPEQPFGCLRTQFVQAHCDAGPCEVRYHIIFIFWVVQRHGTNEKRCWPLLKRYEHFSSALCRCGRSTHHRHGLDARFLAWNRSFLERGRSISPDPYDARFGRRKQCRSLVLVHAVVVNCSDGCNLLRC